MKMNALKIKFSFLLVVLILVIWFVYAPGLSGAIYYDDEGNLYGLVNIVDLRSFWQFITSGEAGPLKRPIALLTFALQAGFWPNPRSFLIVNVIIHIFNAFLLLLITNLILARKVRSEALFRTSWVAFVAVFLWALLPLNVSTSLIVVQRMTSLSVALGLLGLLAYLLQYERYKTWNLYTALAFQFASLGFWVGLAVFSKESAVLIVIFVLVLELTVLKNQSKLIPGYKWRLVLLSFALSALLFYLSPLNLDWSSYIQSRGYSRIQRVSTEWVVLWGYLKSAFFPIPSSFSPFHDDTGVIANKYQLLIAGGGWVVAIMTSYLLRRKSIWPLFAVLWFLAGHLLESTSVSLELVFEHRNYLAVFGPCLALVAIYEDLHERAQPSFKIILGLYVAFIISICFATTSLWGSPKLAAEVWSVSNPGSSRAALHLANLEPENARVNLADTSNIGRVNYKINALDRTISACSTCTAVKVQALLLACGLRSDEEVRERYVESLQGAENARALRPLVDAIYPLISLTASNHCSGLSLQDAKELISRIEKNPLSHGVYYSSRLAYQSAEIAYRLGDIQMAGEELARAEERDPAAIPILEFQIHLAIENGSLEEAFASVQRRREYAGKGLFLTNKYLNEVERDLRGLSNKSGNL